MEPVALRSRLVPYSKRDGGTRPVPTAAILHLIRPTWGYAGKNMHEVTLLRGHPG